VTPRSEVSRVAGVSTGLPSIAIRRSVIIRSTSRREATPARASSLAMRWPSRAAAGGRGGGSVFSVQQSESVIPANASNRSALRHQDPVQPLRAGKERAYMLFSKRERLIRRILVVEDEPLVAFDNEHLLSDAGYDVVGTVDNLSDAARLIDEEEIDLILTDVSLNGEATAWMSPVQPPPRRCRCCSSPLRRRPKRMASASAAWPSLIRTKG
jgi:CheY-like chemotaxis protein